MTRRMGRKSWKSGEISSKFEKVYWVTNAWKLSDFSERRIGQHFADATKQESLESTSLLVLLVPQMYGI
jgi:hypothetical protein